MSQRFFFSESEAINVDLITNIHFEATGGVPTATIHFNSSRSMTLAGDDALALVDTLHRHDEMDAPDDGADLLMETLHGQIGKEIERDSEEAGEPAAAPKGSRG